MSRRSLQFVFLVSLLIPMHVGAQSHARGVSTQRHWSDGPRNVPQPRGRSLARAQRLGLGTRDTARQLFQAPPDSRWVEAAQGRTPHELLWPVEEGRFGRGFGYVRTTQPEKRHNGIDIGAPEGAVVRAVADGIVAYSDNEIRGYGNCILIIHPNRWVTLYGHNSRNTVQPGWRVRRGERIGFIGHTGRANGPHLHFELRVNGEPVDPLPHLADHHGLPGWARAVAAAAPSSVTEPAPSGTDRDSTASDDEPGSVPVGTLTAVRQLLRRLPSESTLAELGGRLFRNLLWPMRGGSLASTELRRRRLYISAPDDAAIRAAADGLVVYADDHFPGFGRAVVMLHRNGWITIYGGASELEVRAGDRVQRGEWIARGTEANRSLAFGLYENGRVQDPLPLLVQVPQ